MKRLLLIILSIFLLAGIVYAKGVYYYGAETVGGCNPAINEVGNRTEESGDVSLSQGYASVFRRQADCTGNLGDAYILHGSTDAGEPLIKIAIYNSTNADLASEGVNATLVACSAAITPGNEAIWYSAAYASGSVVNGNWYWVALFAETGSGATDLKRATTTTSWYRSGSGYYENPPDPLPAAGWSTDASGAPVSAYATIE